VFITGHQRFSRTTRSQSEVMDEPAPAVSLP
jgi:hypothetical protein